MTTHLTARLAWHDNGWNGRICKNPKANTYCVGPRSYPGTEIAEKRDLAWEEKEKNKEISGEKVPPCIYSCNAFGQSNAIAFADPPDFFKDSTETKHWPLPPASVSVWPYEEMYKDEIKNNQGYLDNDKRLQAARDFFKPIENDTSLILYYANYSNPFSDAESPVYVITGISRIKKVGPELFYEGCSDYVKDRFGGGFVWQRTITSHYPDEGFRVPYHLFADDSDTLQKILVTPENPLVCKYGSKHLSDDDLLGLVDRLLEVCQHLIDVGDESENWLERQKWLNGLLAELWEGRGAFPGLPSILNVIEFQEGISWFKSKCEAGEEIDSAGFIFSLLEGRLTELPGLSLDSSRLYETKYNWKRLGENKQRLLKNTLVRFSLSQKAINNILKTSSDNFLVEVSPADIIENPYILAETYMGDSPDDQISWGVIDRGCLPSPDLGIKNYEGIFKLCPQRMRALSLESLRRVPGHVFVESSRLIKSVNYRLSVLPEWKSGTISDDDFLAGMEVYEQALVFKEEDSKQLIYDQLVWEDENLVREKLEEMQWRFDIRLIRSIQEERWREYLRENDSLLAIHASEEYDQAIESLAGSCNRVFRKSLAIISGSAGTGKTTLVKSLIRGIFDCQGEGTSILALAPTGKAADRIRSVLESNKAIFSKVNTETIHSHLARNGWLNDNLTLKRSGGRRSAEATTIIIDECSMVDLELFASLFRSLDWHAVQRLVLIGDENQLPPIGRGKVFFDLIEHFKSEEHEGLVRLDVNLRQMVNRVTGRGNGIIEVATLFRDTEEEKVEKFDIEELIQQLHEGGEIDKDLRVVYYSDPDDLAAHLVHQIENDLALETNANSSSASAMLASNPEALQILAPYRGDVDGIDFLNERLQSEWNSANKENFGTIDGITIGDKVLQFRNRTKSNPIKARSVINGRLDDVNIYNGELGTVESHKYDEDKKIDRLKRLSVKFSRRSDYRVNYGRSLGPHSPNEIVEENLELGYAISVHKAQGSEFDRTYVVVPHRRRHLVSRELLYTAITRAQKHCTLFIEKDIDSVLAIRRKENSALSRINSSLFTLKVVPEELQKLPDDWYESGKIYQSLAEYYVRSKSELLITTMLYGREIEFAYELPLKADDGTLYLPDFTIQWRGNTFYWEHLGMLDDEEYRAKWDKKKKWYEKHFPNQLITTQEGSDLAAQVDAVISTYFT